MFEFTEKQKEKYISDNGLHCPYCGSANIRCKRLNQNRDYILMGVECEDCGKEWTEFYTLTSVEAVED